MSSILIFVILAVAILVIGLVVGLVALVNGRKQPPPAAPVPPTAPSGTITEERPADAPTDEPTDEPAAPVTTLERPEGTASRLVRLRQRLASSQGGLGRGLLRLLS